MSYEQLLAENNELKTLTEQLKSELEMLRRLIFGSKKETFKRVGEDNPNQLSLFEEYQPQEAIIEPQKIKVSYERKAKKHEGRNEIPSHLPVIEEIIEPKEDVEGLVKIGEEITETLEYTPASLVKKVYIRPKYAKKNNEGIVIGQLPSRPIDKGIASSSLLSHIIVSKFIDHLPFYRQIKMYKRNFDIEFSSSTINDWFISICTLIEPLYQVLKTEVLSSPYIQADESPIRVLDQDLEGASHQGYQWVFYSVDKKQVFMHYSKGRSMDGAIKELFMSFKGLLQCDGYSAYDMVDALNKDIDLAACLAHVRRKYFDAQKNDKTRSEKVLQWIQQIYLLERETKDQSIEERLSYRKEHIAPILKEIRTYVEVEAYKVAPKSNIGKAFTYTMNQWTKIIKILDYGELLLDNNLIENKIRPLALGRKNYLFAGSHDGGQRIAMMYSFFGTCAAHGINPYEWLKETLDVIKDTKMSELHMLLPGYKSLV